MRKFTVNLLSLSLGLALMPWAQAANSPQQKQLLEQVRLGESTQREDLVRQSLYRLELIDPNNPDVIAARFRYLLRQGDNAGAQKELDRLKGIAPGSSAYQSSRNTMLLSTPDGRQQLQQARLLATTGHTQEAIAAYDKLFDGNPPGGDVATEYWNVVAKDPARRGAAINQLKKINSSSPGNTQLQTTLAQLLFQSGRRDEGFAVLQEMAKSTNGRGQASDMWYDQIKDQPASSASVSALQKYLNVFSDGDSVAAARAQLEAQQKQLADPAFRAKAEGLAAVDAGQGSKAVAELQKAVSANHADSEAVGALGQAYSQKGDRARAVAQFEKAIALDPQSDNRGKWDSLLKVNRYWLLIQQGDAALKANNPAQAERYYQQARNIDNTDSYAVLGLGDAAAARKDNDAAERYYRQALRMDSGNSNAVRGLANIYRAQSPEKASQFIQSLSASQRRSIDDIERSLTNEQLSAQAEQLENQGKYAQAAEIQRRRLAFDRAKHRRAEILAQRARGEEEPNHVNSTEGTTEADEVELDLDAISTQSLRLVRSILMLIALLSVIFLWSEIHSAFGFLENISLWDVTSTVQGVESLEPITLGAVLIAILVLIITTQLVRNFPALLELALLQHLDLTPGTGYAITTITKYLIMLFGGLVGFSMIGIEWSKLQWLVAALGVGLGFGLQEIFANFISGLIILFEKPIRIGDTVTIRDLTGSITKINTRATTISDWDRKEIIVPNKAFITEQFINWSLSDSVTRVVLTVPAPSDANSEEVTQILYTAAERCSLVIDNPAPEVFLVDLQQGIQIFELRIYAAEMGHRMPLRHEIHQLILAGFREHGIDMPFPPFQMRLESLDGRKTGRTLTSAARTRPAGSL